MQYVFSMFQIKMSYGINFELPVHLKLSINCIVVKCKDLFKQCPIHDLIKAYSLCFILHQNIYKKFKTFSKGQLSSGFE